MAGTNCSASYQDEWDVDVIVVAEYFWSDSKIDLGYIANNAKKFHIYVANRVQIISETTNPSKWFHISGLRNPADIASRGLECTRLNYTIIWFNRPQFLQEYDYTHMLNMEEPRWRRGRKENNIN